ncbi:site-specific integrase [soil metagenome]
MGVALREKKLGKGRVSFYLDIYHNKTRWYEFLEIKINKSHPTEQDKEKKRLATEIRSKRESELIVQDNGLLDRNKRKADFVKWFAEYIKTKTNQSRNNSTLVHLQTYMGKRPLLFTSITPVWIKGFTNYLLSKVSNNSARCYLMDMFTGLEDAIMQEIIAVNPFRKIPQHERIRKQDIFRQSFTLEELETLINTPCKIHPQIKQGYIFSCFTGLRWSDVNCLRWSEIIKKQIDGQEQYFIYFEQEKTEDIEYMPLSDQAIEIIKERENEAKDEPQSIYVFPRIKERDPKNNPTHKRVNYSLKKWSKAAGLMPITFHTARHSFATNVLENSEDGDLYTVSKLLGHKSISSTQIYAHVRDKRKAAAVKALPKITLRVVSHEAA